MNWFLDKPTRRLAALGWLLAGMLFPATASAEPMRIARNDSTVMHREFAVTFWTDYEHYAVLPPDMEKDLLANPVIRAPEGVEVHTLEVSIRRETYQTKPHPALKGPQEVQSYERYVIAGRWSVRAGEKCPEGKQSISISFPQISATARKLGAGKDEIRGAPSSGIVIELEVFPDQAALDRQLNAEAWKRWPEYLALVLGWSLLAVTVIVAIYGCILYARGHVKANERPAARDAGRALVNCRECRAVVSRDALACPYCGAAEFLPSSSGCGRRA